MIFPPRARAPCVDMARRGTTDSGTPGESGNAHANNGLRDQYGSASDVASQRAAMLQAVEVLHEVRHAPRPPQGIEWKRLRARKAKAVYQQALGGGRELSCRQVWRLPQQQPARRSRRAPRPPHASACPPSSSPVSVPPAAPTDSAAPRPADQERLQCYSPTTLLAGLAAPSCEGEVWCAEQLAALTATGGDDLTDEQVISRRSRLLLDTLEAAARHAGGDHLGPLLGLVAAGLRSAVFCPPEHCEPNASPAYAAAGAAAAAGGAGLPWAARCAGLERAAAAAARREAALQHKLLAAEQRCEVLEREMLGQERSRRELEQQAADLNRKLGHEERASSQRKTDLLALQEQVAELRELLQRADDRVKEVSEQVTGAPIPVDLLDLVDESNHEIRQIQCMAPAGVSRHSRAYSGRHSVPFLFGAHGRLSRGSHGGRQSASLPPLPARGGSAGARPRLSSAAGQLPRAEVRSGRPVPVVSPCPSDTGCRADLQQPREREPLHTPQPGQPEGGFCASATGPGPPAPAAPERPTRPPPHPAGRRVTPRVEFTGEGAENAGAPHVSSTSGTDGRGPSAGTQDEARKPLRSASQVLAHGDSEGSRGRRDSVPMSHGYSVVSCTTDPHAFDDGNQPWDSSGAKWSKPPQPSSDLGATSVGDTGGNSDEGESDDREGSSDDDGATDEDVVLLHAAEPGELVDR
eukprot:TRINITY_DN3676_c0_g1_i4.p1 TRINITY_DN3676_c0_g1~~TRINITY_DN3676_c0_g1_i4.p1  ORF type:complete len:693 (+),score=99.41 TRINITY_DN3676_c0_g1_i4:54-2132(+)